MATKVFLAEIISLQMVFTLFSSCDNWLSSSLVLCPFVWRCGSCLTVALDSGQPDLRCGPAVRASPQGPQRGRYHHPGTDPPTGYVAACRPSLETCKVLLSFELHLPHFKVWIALNLNRFWVLSFEKPWMGLIHRWHWNGSRALKVAYRHCLQCHVLLEVIIIDLLND